MLKIIVYFKACFGEILTKLALFYAILTLNLEKNFIFEDLAFFETAYDQIWPLDFLDLATLECSSSCHSLLSDHHLSLATNATVVVETHICI